MNAPHSTTHLRFIPWFTVVTTLLASLMFAQPAASQGVPKPATPAPEGEYALTINTWLCDSGVTFDTHDAEDLFANCGTPFDGVRFRFWIEGGGERFAMSQGGTVRFAIPDPDKIYTVTADDLPGFDSPTTHCVALDADGTVIADLGTYERFRRNWTFSGNDLHEGTQIRCDWYHIPDSETSDGEGTLTIVPWTCPEGYDPAASGADPINDCGKGPNGVPFTLSDTSGATSDVVVETGAVTEDAVSFPDLEPGTYTITETAPGRTSSFFVWQGCVDPPDPSLPAFTAPQPVSEGATVAHHADGNARICHWFNVP